jgi:hypothetical protein
MGWGREGCKDGTGIGLHLGIKIFKLSRHE